ncbi:MAG: hypothetical protein RR705_08210 [Lachnospiraceae bacterium]
MANIDGLFGVLALACGLYCLYAGFSMKKTGEINQTVLLSKDVNPKKCKDKELYMKCVIPKVFVLGATVSAYGIISLIDAYVVRLGLLVIVFLIVVLMVLIWYGITTSKASKKYF